MAGVPAKTVQELMRHKSYAMTSRYSHLSESHKKEAVAALEGLDLRQFSRTYCAAEK